MAGIMTAAACCLFFVSVSMGIKMWKLKRDISSFTDRLLRCLNDMTCGRELERLNEEGDTLWDKVYEKLQKLERIWKRESAENLEEKKKIKSLISDISHQTKTPIANIKLYEEVLLDEGLGTAEAGEFLQKVRIQTEKLDFLLQSMVKMLSLIHISMTSCTVFISPSNSKAFPGHSSTHCLHPVHLAAFIWI